MQARAGDPRAVGALCPRVGCIATNLETDRLRVVRFYNKRGTAEQWIKEGKQAVKTTRRSRHRFGSNAVRPWRRPVKIGGRLVKHARYYWLMPAGSHLTRRLSGSMVGRIGALAMVAG